MSKAVLAKPILLLFLALALCIPATSENFTPIRPEVVSPRLASIGGPHTAIEVGFETLLTNPAALAFVEKETSFGRLAVRVSGPIFDLPALFESNNMAGDILDMVSKYNGVSLGAQISGPLSFGLVNTNFGYGVFNRTVTHIFVPSLSLARITAGEEFFITGGYGAKVIGNSRHTLSAGMQMKGFVQVLLHEEDDALTTLTKLVSMNPNNFSTYLVTGFGLDVGLLYRFANQLNVGLICRDVYTPVFWTRYSNFNHLLKGDSVHRARYTTILPVLSAGLSWEPVLPESWATISGFSLMLDYRDILAPLQLLHRNPILNIAAGAELELLETVTLRAGIQDTYPSVGLGLDLTLFTLDMAIYGSEVSKEPGRRPMLNLALGLNFVY